jgi:GTP-binding protein HflX
MEPASAPRVLKDTMELDGQSVPRIFVSALAGTGLPELRALLASIVLERVAAGESSGEDVPSDDPAP